jgi:hypothetical protein
VPLRTQAPFTGTARFTGTAGVPPADLRKTLRRVYEATEYLSRFALIAGGTPAVPVMSLNDLTRLAVPLN